MPRLQLLVATMNLTDIIGLCDKMHIASDALIINQSDCVKYECLFYHGYKIECYTFAEEMRSQYLLYAFPTMLKMAYEYCFITFGEKYLKNPIAMNIRDFLIKYDYKKDTEYCSPTIASLMWISEEERKISLKMYIDNDNIWVQIVLWGMILANICMLEEVFEDEMKIDSGLSVEM